MRSPAALFALALACGAALADVPPSARPQLSAAEAARHTVADYLGDWRPGAFDATALKPDFIVAADGSGTHRTVQAAVDAVPDAQGSTAPRRHVIQIRPGSYREALCVQGKGPLVLMGVPGRPTAVTLVEGRYNALPKRAGAPAHACHPDLKATSHGTPGSASIVFASDDLTAAFLTIANDAMDHVKAGVGYPEGVGESGGAQAVALMTAGDRVLLEQVRLLGHQDTLHMRRRTPDAPARVLVRGSLIAGDVDFIFGNATLVIDDSTILSRAGRRTPGSGGHVLAPSTLPGVALGMLVTRSRFVAEPGVAQASISLGRAWDEGVPRGEWQRGRSPNGQALVRDSLLGPHLAPWAASTSRRPFSASGEQANRMAEFNNRTAPADPAREALATGDGWGSEGAGTTGGAGASAAHVHVVRDRAQLAAALRSPPGDGNPPRIVKVVGRIDLSVDDQGRPMGYEDYRDPDFDQAAFERAYDPASWGKRNPEGALEAARQRSARRQAERVQLRVPSNTTVVGVGTGAHLINGGLLLDNIDNVILRNLRISDAYDHFPAWDPNDNASGEWNSEYDTVSLRNATHVWVDHCSFDDGERPDAAEPVRLGRRVQHHDGLLDITRASNFVTVSWNHFSHHDKTSLVGGGDKATADDGKLKVTFHHNLWEDTKERSPRVRYGQVHVYNNLHLVRGSEFGYSLGVGIQSRLFSEHNVWDTPADVASHRLVRVYKGQTFFDRGSLHNGAPVDLNALLRATYPEAGIGTDVGWQPSLYSPVDPAHEVAARVRAHAGAGRLWMGPE
jgi:pectate lyase/pectin methylesterase-like acyl-CoA thioesterase